MNLQGFLFGLATVVVLVLVVHPLSRLLQWSLFPPGESPTFRYFFGAWSDPFLREAVTNTLVVSGGAAILAVIFGTILAWIVARTEVPFAQVFENIAFVPFIAPPFLVALAWVWLTDPQIGPVNQLLRPLGIAVTVQSRAGLACVLGLLVVPYVFALNIPAFKSTNPEFEEAASVCGADSLSITRHITFPLVLPAILSAGLLAFVNAATMYGVHAVLGGPVNLYLLTTAIQKSISSARPAYEQAAALSLIFLVLTGSGLYLETVALGKSRYVTMAGKGVRQRYIGLGPWRYVACSACLLYFLVSLVLPVGGLLFRALQPYAMPFTLSGLSKLTTKNFVYVLFDYSPTKRAIYNSFMLGFLGATSVSALAMIVGYIIARRASSLAGILRFLTMIPLAAPGTVLGIGILLAYLRSPLYGTIWILLIAYITRELPIGVRIVSSSLQQIGTELEESARVSGATWFRSVKLIVYPLISFHLLSAWLLMFVAIIREIAASRILASWGSEVIGTAIMDLWEAGITPEAGAASVIAIVASIVVGFGVQVIARRTHGFAWKKR